MANQEPITEADGRLLFQALRGNQVSEDLAYTAVQEVRNMAGQNVFSAIEALRAQLNGKIDALAAEHRATRWMVVTFLALVVTLNAVGLMSD